MADDVNKRLSELLSDADRAKLSDLAGAAGAKKLAGSLSEEQKRRLCEEFMKLDAAELKRKLKSVDLSKLSGADAAEILKKLR